MLFDEVEKFNKDQVYGFRWGFRCSSMKFKNSISTEYMALGEVLSDEACTTKLNFIILIRES